MGCDIHFYVEKRVDRMNRRDINGRFETTGTWQAIISPARDHERWPVVEGDRASFAWGPDGCMYEGECYGDQTNDDDHCVGEACKACLGTGRKLRWWSMRDYRLFGILAGVREGSLMRWAPRGCPDNVSSTVKSYYTWDHSASWLGLREVLETNFDREMDHDGLIPIFETGNTWDDSLERMIKRDAKEPEGYSRGRSGNFIELDEAKRLIAQAGRDASLRNQHRDSHTRVRWIERERDQIQTFLDFIEQLVIPETLGDTEYAALKLVHDDGLRLRDDGADNPAIDQIWKQMMALASNVRFVFGFDN